MADSTGKRWAVSGLVLVVCCVAGLAVVWLLAATAGTTGDPFDSPIFWWLWVLLPACGIGAGLLWPTQARYPVWSAAFFGPAVVLTALAGTTWHDPEDGASFWILGEMLIVVLWAVTYAASLLSATVRRAFDAQPSLPPPPDTRWPPAGHQPKQ